MNINMTPSIDESGKTTPHGEERYLYIDQNEVGMVDTQDKIVQLRVFGQGKGAEIGAAIALEKRRIKYTYPSMIIPATLLSLSISLPKI